MPFSIVASFRSLAPDERPAKGLGRNILTYEEDIFYFRNMLYLQDGNPQEMLYCTEKPTSNIPGQGLGQDVDSSLSCPEDKTELAILRTMRKRGTHPERPCDAYPG